MKNFQDNIICRSTVMQQVCKKLDPLVHSAVPLIFWGATGSGAAFYARAIHEASREGKFLKIPCISLGEDKIKEQLFGVGDRRGWLEEADNGTILFRLLKGSSPAVQQILYHLLSLQSVNGCLEFSRMGRVEQVEVNVRLIFSLAGDFDVVFQDRLLDRDLMDFMRKHAEIIRIPPLRERKEDIIPLVYDLFEDLNEKYHQHVSAIEPKARKLLTQYHWPGNINELKQVMTDIFSRYSRITTIAAEHLPAHLKNSKITGSKYFFELKGNERFIGKIRSRSLRVRSTLQKHSIHRIDTRTVVKILREEDTRFSPPKMKHFALTLKDGSHLPVMILDKTMKVETSFDPAYQINVQDLHEVVLS